MIGPTGPEASPDLPDSQGRPIFLRFVLQIAACHVEANSQPVDMLMRILDPDIATAALLRATTSSASKWKLVVSCG